MEAKISDHVWEIEGVLELLNKKSNWPTTQKSIDKFL